MPLALEISKRIRMERDVRKFRDKVNVDNRRRFEFQLLEIFLPNPNLLAP